MKETPEQSVGEPGSTPHQVPPQQPADPSADSGAPSADSDPLLGALIGERYRIQQVIGHGGMGTVYAAEHVLMEKRVALKVLHPDLAVVSTVMDRFQKEAVALSRIDHPNVVSATDFGKRKNGAYYLALQYIEGESLADVVQREGVLNVDYALGIAIQIARALSAAHTHNIVHRDLKPHNVMLVPGLDAFPVVKVLDFGLAKLRSKTGEGPTTRAGAVLGTPQYMAPEQVTGESVDGRADIYALGVLLYEMLTGRTPFQSQDVRELLGMHCTQAPPQLPDHIPQQIRVLVMRALEKTPDDRYQSADEMVVEMDAYLRPPSMPAAGLAPWYQRQLNVLGLVVPLWGLLLPALVFAALFSTGVALSVGEQTPASQSPPTTNRAKSNAAQPIPPNLPPEPDRWPSLISAAEFGDEEAVEELLRIPPEKRDSEVWLVLGRGQMVRKQTEAALELYREAIHHMPELKNNESIAENVRLATTDSRTAQQAVTVAAEALGSRGVDILFAVWANTAKRTPASALAERYMEQDKVRAKASPQVKLALDLRQAEEMECQQVLQLVQQAIEYGDTRSLRPLWQLKSRVGCGPAKLKDCYSCLRQGNLLAQATKKASKRRAPDF